MQARQQGCHAGKKKEIDFRMKSSFLPQWQPCCPVPPHHTPLSIILGVFRSCLWWWLILGLKTLEWARQALYPSFIALEGLVTFWRLSRRFGGFFQPLAGFFQPSGGFPARFCQKSPEIWPRWSFLPPRPQSCSRNHGGRSRRSREEHRPSSGLNQVSYTSLLLIVSLGCYTGGSRRGRTPPCCMGAHG